MTAMRRRDDDQILEAMRDMETPAGAMQLAERLRIPPASIGRSLLRLENQGLVAKVQNKGRVITDKGRQRLEDQRSKQHKMQVASELIEAASVETEANLRDILLVRCLLEGYTAKACTEHIRPEELEELKDIQFDYVYELKHGRTGSEEDLKLHLKIAEIAGSPTITRVLRLILTDQNAYATFTRAAMQTESLKYNEHDDILAAIKSGDGERAKAEMEKHLSRVGANVHNYLQ